MQRLLCLALVAALPAVTGELTLEMGHVSGPVGAALPAPEVNATVTIDCPTAIVRTNGAVTRLAIAINATPPVPEGYITGPAAIEVDPRPCLGVPDPANFVLSGEARFQMSIPESLAAFVPRPFEFEATLPAQTGIAAERATKTVEVATVPTLSLAVGEVPQSVEVPGPSVTLEIPVLVVGNVASRVEATATFTGGDRNGTLEAEGVAIGNPALGDAGTGMVKLTFRAPEEWSSSLVAVALVLSPSIPDGDPLPPYEFSLLFRPKALPSPGFGAPLAIALIVGAALVQRKRES